MNEIELELNKQRQKNYELKHENLTLKQVLQELGNELCLQCGRYKDEHLGACDMCKYRKIKTGDFQI